MPCRERLAVERVPVYERIDSLPVQKLLHLVAELSLLCVLVPPGVIHAPVAHAAPRIVTERRRRSVAAEHRRSVEVASVRSQACLRSGDAMKKIAAYVRGLRPEIAILSRTPSRPQFVERGQMIRSVRH